MDTILFSQPLSDADLDRAAAIIRGGGLLGIPTETVYGLGADGLNETAVLHIFEAKGRPQDNPLILHVPDAGWLPKFCRDIPHAAYALARRFWPGPLTMILPRREVVNAAFLRECVEDFVLLIAPFAPHFAEELHEMLGHKESVFKCAYPTCDEKALVRDEYEMAVQVNSRVKAKIVVLIMLQ